MQNELNLFKGLFQNVENIAILHINNRLDFLNPIIDEITKQYNGFVTLKNFENEATAQLRATAREYEYIILSDILFYCENKKNIIKIMYKALENSANIIILEKKSNNNLEEIKKLLDDNSFVAINNIDLFEDYELITAKKLHMWGSGL